MNEDYARQVLRAVLGSVCQPLGVHGLRTNVCDALVDVLRQYLMAVGRSATAYCTHANRTEPNLCDLSQAFRSLSVDLGDLAEFLREVDSQPLDQRVPRFPVARSSTHIYHGPASFGEVTKKRSRAPSLSSEDEEYDHIPSYLPPFPSQRRESVKDEDGASSGGLEVAEATVDTSSKDDRLTTPTPVDPFRGLPQLFRPRGFSSDFSEDGEGGATAAGGSRRSSVSDSLAATMGLVGGSGQSTAVVRASPPDSRGSRPSSAKDSSVFIDDGPPPEQPSKRTPTPPGSRETGGSKRGSNDKEIILLQTSPEMPAPGESTDDVEGGNGGFLFPTSRAVPSTTSRSATGRGSNLSGYRELASVNVTPVTTLAGPVKQPANNTTTRLADKGRGSNMPPPLTIMSPITPTSPKRSASRDHPSLSPLAISPGGSTSTSGGFKFGVSQNLPVLSPLQVTPKPTTSSFPMPPASVIQASSPPSIPNPSKKILHSREITPPTSYPSGKLLPPSRGSQSPLEEERQAAQHPIVSCSPSSSEDENEDEVEDMEPSPTTVVHPNQQHHPAEESHEEGVAHHTPVVSCSPSSSDDENEEYETSAPSLKGPSEKCLEQRPVTPPTPRSGNGSFEEVLPTTPVVSCSPTSSEEEEEEEVEQETEEEVEEEVKEEVAPKFVGKFSESIAREESADVAQMALEQLSSNEEEEEDNEDRGIFGFEQDLLPERMSFSPAPPPALPVATAAATAGVTTRSSPPLVMMSEQEDDIMLEEVATLESGVSGSESVVVQSSSLGLVGRRDDDEVPLNLDEIPPAIEKYGPSPIRPSGVRRRRLSRGKTSRRGVRRPPAALPCSPLVVHFKRSMVPSLRLEVVKKEKDVENEAKPRLPEGLFAADEPASSTQFKTKAEIKAEQFSQMTPYPMGRAPQTPSSSPTPPSSPMAASGHSLSGSRPSHITPHAVKLTPLTVSIKRHILPSSRQSGHAQPRPLPASSPATPSHSRVKKLLAQFGGGSTTPPIQSQNLATPSFQSANPRKRELDLSELTFGGPHSKKLKQEVPEESSPTPPSFHPPAQSSSASSSSSDEDEVGGASDSNSTHSGSSSPAHSHHHPHHLAAPVRLPARLQTPVSVEKEGDDDEREEERSEDPMAASERSSSVDSSNGSGGRGVAALTLTIDKSRLPSRTVQHLGVVSAGGDKGGKRKKSQKVQKGSSLPTPMASVWGPDSGRLKESGGRGLASTRGNTGGSTKGKTATKKKTELWNPLPAAVPTPQPVLSHGSDTICPECGLKDDGSPMIGCDHCDSWVHWVCCGITQAPPEDQKWYCPDCQKAGVGAEPAASKKKSRKKKRH